MGCSPHPAGIGAGDRPDRAAHRPAVSARAHAGSGDGARTPRSGDAGGPRLCPQRDRPRDTNRADRRSATMQQSGPLELFLVLVIALLVLGPKRLPDPLALSVAASASFATDLPTTTRSNPNARAPTCRPSPTRAFVARPPPILRPSAAPARDLDRRRSPLTSRSGIPSVLD
jgi:hypothetical protein